VSPAGHPRAAQLAAEATAAARIRALSTDPDVIALRVERIRAQVDGCAWVAIGLGLAFTMTNVQVFAAAGAPAWTAPWVVAWLLDPMVSLLLIAVLRAEQVTARWQVPTGARVTAAKWGCFAATYAMNTWGAWTAGVPSGVVLHSVPPLVVLLGAEVAPELRDRLTAAVHAAAVHAAAPPAGRPSLPGEAAPTADDPGQDRVGALAVPPTAGPRPGPEPELDVGPSPAAYGLGATEADPADDAPADDPADEAPADAAVVDPDVGLSAAGDDTRQHRDGLDPRVLELAELLDAGAAVTGAQAAALAEVSDRQGRRLLREAREQAATAAIPARPGPARRDLRGRLRVVSTPTDPTTDTTSTDDTNSPTAGTTRVTGSAPSRQRANR